MNDGTTISIGSRDRIRGSLEPFARLVGRTGLTPNALTLIGFAIAVLAAYMAATQVWLYAGVLVGFGALFDLLDGAVARATGRTSKLGGFLDSTLDRAGEGVVYLGLVIGLLEVGYQLGPQLAAAAMASAFMVSYTRAKSESLGFTPGTGMAKIGLAPREVRIGILTAGLILAGLLVAPAPTGGAGGAVSPVWHLVLIGSLGLITLLATITTIQRIVHVYREANEMERSDPDAA